MRDKKKKPLSLEAEGAKTTKYSMVTLDITAKFLACQSCIFLQGLKYFITLADFLGRAGL